MEEVVGFRASGSFGDPAEGGFGRAEDRSRSQGVRGHGQGGNAGAASPGPRAASEGADAGAGVQGVWLKGRLGIWASHLLAVRPGPGAELSTPRFPRPKTGFSKLHEKKKTTTLLDSI